MPLPTLTEEQRKDALAKAAEARRRRAELKAQLKSEKMSLREVLARQGDDTVGKMKVSSVLESLPGVGKVRARSLVMQPAGDPICRGDMGAWLALAVGSQPAFEIVQATAATHDPRLRDQV